MLAFALVGCGRINYSVRDVVTNGDVRSDVIEEAPTSDLVTIDDTAPDAPRRDEGGFDATGEVGSEPVDVREDAVLEESGPSDAADGFDGDAAETTDATSAADVSDTLEALDASDASDVSDASIAPDEADAHDTSVEIDAMDAIAAPDAGDAFALVDAEDATDARVDAADAPACEAGTPTVGATLTLPMARAYRVDDPISFTVRFDEPIRIAAGHTNDVRGVLATLRHDLEVAPSPAGTTLTREFTFTRLVTPDDYDADSIDVGVHIRAGHIEDASGCPRSVTINPSTRTNVPGAIIHAGFACPQDFVYVPPSAEYGLPQGFCISATEMAPGATPVSAPLSSFGRAPATGTSRANAIAACAALGPGYHLTTNAEWQAVVRNVERTPDNWSGLAPGRGRLNVGNTGVENGGIPNTDRPCRTMGFDLRFPDCLNRANAPAWEHKRTHFLSNGARVWDLGGNNPEWVSDVPTRTPRAYACALAGEDQRLYGPALVYSPCPASTAPEGDAFGIGYAEGSGGDAIQRGSGSNLEGGAFFAVRGIFYSNTNSFWSGGPAIANGPGYRCAYLPVPAPVAQPMMDPVSISVRSGTTVALQVTGNAPADLTWSIETDARPVPLLIPDGAGVRFTASGSTSRDHTVRARAGDGRVFTALVRIDTPGI